MSFTSPAGGLAAGEADEAKPLLPALKHADQAVALGGVVLRLGRRRGIDQVVRAVAEPPAVHQSLDRPLHVGRLVLRQFQLLGDDPRLDRPIAGGGDEFENGLFKMIHVSVTCSCVIRRRE